MIKKLIGLIVASILLAGVSAIAQNSSLPGATFFDDKALTVFWDADPNPYGTQFHYPFIKMGESDAKHLELKWMSNVDEAHIRAFLGGLWLRAAGGGVVINISNLRIRKSHLIITDASEADSIDIYDDGTNARIDPDNPLIIDNSFIQQVGSDVASASTITLSPGNIIPITGTTQIDSIDTASLQSSGSIIYLMFAASVTVADGKNLKLAGNQSATADDVLILVRKLNNFHQAAPISAN